MRNCASIVIGSGRLHRAAVIIAMIAVAHAACAQEAARVVTFNEDTGGAVDAVFAEFGSVTTPGYAAGIIRNGRLVYARGFGAANLDYRIPITPRSAFNVASLSKQFTAAAIALLVLEGKVSLAHPLGKHIAETPARFRDVRLEHLVYMTSGLPEYYRQPRPGGRTWDRDVFTVDDAIAATFAAPRLEFAPGSRWAYSNVNYMLLAKIVERVSGESFAAFLRRRIFGPLEMNDTHVNDDVTRVVANRVVGYNHRAGGGFHRHDRISPHYGGSGVFTTIEDLAKWDRSFESHTLAGPKLTSLLLSTKKFAHGKANDAFGLVWGEYDGLRTLSYEGGDLGFSSYMVRFPDEGLTIIVLSNLGTGRAADKAREVLKVLIRRR
jgi:CubicO group peptidase (beta-lactamase class C family)